MTIPDFKTILSDSILGSSGAGILTLFNTASATTSTIDAVAVRIGQLTVNDLRQATQLSFKTPSGSEYLHISLQSSTIPRRLVNTSIVENYFVYEIYPPEQRAVIITPNTSSDGYLEDPNSDYLLQPTLTLKRFATSDYNVLVGSIDESRESIHIVKSDRSSTRTTGSLLNPLNISSIVAGTAEPADVQDSNYSSITWINGRYEGSKITTATNGGTDPFIQGTFFEGAFFSKDIQDAIILSASAAGNLQYIQNFSTGKLETPRYVVEELNLSTAAVAYSPSASFLQLTSSATPLNKNLTLGDLFVFSGSTSGFSQEVLRLTIPTGSLGQQYFPYEFLQRTPTKEIVQIRLQRGYSSTKAATIPIETACYRIVNTKIYTLVGTKIVPATQSKLIIRGANEVIYLSSDGLIISGSNRVEYEDL